MSEVYECATVVKSVDHATQDIKLAMLLPHEMAHGLFMHNPQKFHELFSTDRLECFWANAIERSKAWSVKHPQYLQICSSHRRSKLFCPFNFPETTGLSEQLE